MPGAFFEEGGPMSIPDGPGRVLQALFLGPVVYGSPRSG